MSDIDKWIDIAKECKYLPENDLKVINIYEIIFIMTLWIGYMIYVEDNLIGR